MVNYHLANIRDPIIIRIGINLAETRIGPFKTQETTPEVILEGNTPRIIKTSLPTTLKINNIIPETYQEVNQEEETQTLKIGHIVEVKIKDINLGAHSADMTAPRIHTQLGTTIDLQIDLEMDHTIDPEIEMTHRKDMKIHMVKGINHKKETLHTLGKEIIAKIETTEKEKETHLNQEATAITEPQTIQQTTEKETHHSQETTAITGPQTIQQKKGTPHIPEEGALPETGTTTELLHQALTHLQDS